MLTVYGDIRSGNCYKIRLLLDLLGREYAWRHVDVLAGGARTAEFLALNPNGKVPLLQLEDGATLAESNAILYLLAQGSRFWPQDALLQARVLQWQFFEQYSHEPYIAVARFINLYLGLPAERRADYEAKQGPGHQALAVMETQLRQTPYLCGADYSIADISLYAYTHVAHEGGFDLSGYPALQAWLLRIAQQPGHKTIAAYLTEQTA
ncbi:glutathione S-transferase family protein [Massilia sp. W12]|uniref:glutathione S-transferase family protein n=1 Tax=Massilia sp. W12 TaxID=3126507 RepID=UPI0030CF32F9